MPTYYDPLADTDLCNARELNKRFTSLDAGIVVVDGLPTGSVLATAGSSAAAGWLICDGAEISRSTYADLFNAIGTAFGSGDGLTTFNLPDLRGRVPIGAGTGSGLSARTLAQQVGAETHQLVTNEMRAHTHIVAALAANTASGAATDSSTTAVATDSTGSDTPHNNVQPTLFLNLMIKV